MSHLILSTFFFYCSNQLNYLLKLSKDCTECTPSNNCDFIIIMTDVNIRTLLDSCLSAYTDRVVEVATYDNHYIFTKMFMRRTKSSLTSVVGGRCTDSCCLIALGFESGNIELFREPYSIHSTCLTGESSAVLSVAISEQV